MRSEWTHRELERLTAGIHESLDGFTRSELLPQRLEALERIAQLAKALRTLSNRETMELERIIQRECKRERG